MLAQLPRIFSPFSALTIILLGLILLTLPAAQAAPFAYISRGNALSVLDTENNIVTATVALGASSTYAVAVNPAGTRVYMANVNNVLVIDTISNTIIATVAVGTTTFELAINPTGTRVYVTNYNSNNVSVIDTATNTVIATVAVGKNPFGVAVHPDGTRVYVANTSSNTVSVIDTTSNTVTDNVTLSGGTAPYHLAVNPAGTRVYVTDGANSVSVIDTACNAVIATVPVGSLASDIAINPAGTRVYVTNAISSNVSVIDTVSNSVIATVAVGQNPRGVAVNPSGSRVYVANSAEGENTISVLDSASNTVIATVVVGTFPSAISFASAVVPITPPVVEPNHLRVTGMEVTQGIQDLAGSVLLISGRRTFVRVYVQSDGPVVPGVTARLNGAGNFSSGGSVVRGVPLGSLVPVNTVGPRITVRPNPQRSNLNDSFLFELPWKWTNFQAVNLKAELSSGPEAPKSCTPSLSDPLYGFETPTTLKIQFIRLSYSLPGTFNGITDAYIETSLLEQNKTKSFISRTYPLSELLSTPDAKMFDAGLGYRVERISLDCQVMKPEEINLCAHHYITGQLAALQARIGPFGLQPGPLLEDADAAYALIPQVPNDPPPGSKSPNRFFTRGACCTSRTGAGPSNVPDYAAHELGHFLGRQHPVEGAEECGHSADDPNYPYFLSYIGPGILGPVASLHPESDLAGFDGGDPNLLIPMGYLYGQNAFDIMGYCKPNKWISDYTYKNLYICLSSLNADRPGFTPGCGPAGDTRLGATVAQPGDWLMVFGNISSNPAVASFIQTRRVDSIVNMPARTPGNHSIRLIGAGGSTLADYPFTPDVLEEGLTSAGVNSPFLNFGQVVPFVVGTQEIQIVDTAQGGTVIGTKTVSTNPPTISNVALLDQIDPATGKVTLGWSAQDQDGDPLTFDIFYTRNNGASLQPLMLNLSGTNVKVDTADLGGGPAQLRVAVSDGVLSTFADTLPFTLAYKPPQPRILMPGDGATIHVGQLINLEGGATDPQDGVIPDTGLTWSSPGRQVGSGARLSITDLQVGINKITLTAINSAGLSNSTTATVNVQDNLDQPGPTLTAGPGEIGWHIGVGESKLQTAALDIGNSGSGNLKFTAHSSAPWLTISTAAGTAPATLTLTADPTGLSGGVTEVATVTLAAVDFPSQVITTPVSLAVGNTFSVGNATPTVNQSPTANAGPDQTVRQGSLVTLNGNASIDPDSSPSPLTYAWAQASSLTATLTGEITTSPQFTPGIKGIYTFSLVVNDGQSNSVPDNVNITVPSLGDIDLDGDVDSSDLSRITSILNKPANDSNDLRDINGDLKIDALDTRKLVLLCTRPRCATQ